MPSQIVTGKRIDDNIRYFRPAPHWLCRNGRDASSPADRAVRLMSVPEPGEPVTAPAASAARAASFAVHLFTASGGALALLALIAATERRWTAMFGWLAVSLAVDGLDGEFARRLSVKEVLPRWSGDILDLVVDILTYVFVPAYALVVADLLPAPVALALGCAIVITSVLYFADAQMKSTDNYFIGFPGIWNLVAFFLFLWRLPQWAAAALVVAFCVLTFVPVPFLHPMRVRRGRMVNIVLVCGGAALAALALVNNLAPGPFVTVPLSLIGLYLLAVGWLRREA
jgi:phosphatidylcholine synthase